MSSSPHNARLIYLDRAARQYALTAPATSAHLMMQRNVEAERHSIVIREDANSGSFCKACGSVLIPSSTARVTIRDPGALKSQRRSKRQKLDVDADKDREAEAKKAKVLVVECRACRRFVERALPAAEKSQPATFTPNTKATLPGTDAPTLANAVGAQAPTSKNTTSKHRAKARKGGLQAILDKSKQNVVDHGSGLDLMDLMKRD